ncbi:hypothetical protein FAF44_53325, partial [Nonomuraea sp. MG754425]|nr:hypothetical protein [Nonomuraea sp. MG754425]
MTSSWRTTSRNVPSPCRVLDVGSGQGTQALRMAARGHHVTALDASR